MKKKNIIAIFIIIIAIISLLLVVELVLHPHPFTFSPTLPAGTYQGMLSSVSPPQLAHPGINISIPLVWE